MREGYAPASDFLKSVVAGDAPLSGSEYGDANLCRLVDMTRDSDRSNRDWAVFLLSQEDVDTPAVRDALLHAAADEDVFVRAEAIRGLAKRDAEAALPLVRSALAAETVAAPIFEVAAFLAHPSLVNELRRWRVPSDDSYLDELALEALTACETGTSIAL